eukprot:Nk52_evm32s222 gene=Nk52_evmTU32s222
MVTFTCNGCGDSLKKAKVDGHIQRCSTHSVDCIDCGVEFSLYDYHKHTSCISEAEKYQGALYQGKRKGAGVEGKGKGKKSANVFEIILDERKDELAGNGKLKNTIEQLAGADNVPFKKRKLINYLGNSFRIRDEKLCEKIWSLFEEESEKLKMEKNASKQKPVTAGGQKPEASVEKRKAEATEEEDSFKKAKVADNSVDFKWKKAIVETMEAAGGEMPLKKLKKKVLKKYLKEASCEMKEELKDKLEGIIEKKINVSSKLELEGKRVKLSK